MKKIALSNDNFNQYMYLSHQSKKYSFKTSLRSFTPKQKHLNKTIDFNRNKKYSDITSFNNLSEEI